MEEELWKSLPEPLVENFVARMPFPSIFKARCLSKSWRARFSSIASLEDEMKKRAATSFQKLVIENSINWKTFCPVFITKQGDVGLCDMENHNWRSLPSISFLPKSVMSKGNLNLEGALVYSTCDEGDGSVVVANIITQALTILKPPLHEGRVKYKHSKLVVAGRSSQTYKLILLSDRMSSAEDCVQIYNSKAKAWSNYVYGRDRRTGFTPYSNSFSSVFLDGVLYLASQNVPKHLWVCNLEEQTLKEHSVRSPNGWITDEGDCTFCNVVCCNTDLIMVIGGFGPLGEVLKIDVESLNVVDYSILYWHFDACIALLCPTVSLCDYFGEYLTIAMSDGCHIFCGCQDDEGCLPLVAYNVKDRTWTDPCDSSTLSRCNKIRSFQPGRCNNIVSFQPGLCPFLWEV
jgi:hypothetical protein